jgi:hypothetical protein
MDDDPLAIECELLDAAASAEVRGGILQTRPDLA